MTTYIYILYYSSSRVVIIIRQKKICPRAPPETRDCSIYIFIPLFSLFIFIYYYIFFPIFSPCILLFIDTYRTIVCHTYICICVSVLCAQKTTNRRTDRWLYVFLFLQFKTLRKPDHIVKTRYIGAYIYIILIMCTRNIVKLVLCPNGYPL